MRISARTKRVALVFVLLIAGAAAWMMLMNGGRSTFVEGKSWVRQALGLPKIWKTTFNTDTGRYRRVACPTGHPLVLMTGGQSNAANGLSDPVRADPAAAAFMFYDNACYLLQDPVLGATDTGGSLWTELGQRVAAATGRPVVLIDGAVGGVQLGDWLDDRSGYLDRLATQARGAAKAGLRPDAVLWVQGETDAAVNRSGADYARDQQALVARMDKIGITQPTTKWIVFRSTSCLDRAGSGKDIEAGLDALSVRDPRVLEGPLASRLGPAYRRDGCHFNAAGRKVLVDETLPILLGALSN